MCGIAGFCNINADFTNEYSKWHHVLYKMKQVLKHRGPDDEGDLLVSKIGLAHTRLSIIDINRGHQPITKQKSGSSYSIIYNGELYNTTELRDKLINMGYLFKTHTDTEVILTGFMAFGEEFVTELNGIFSFAIWDDNSRILFLVRDRFGVKPLFYTLQGDTIIFASEIKALFEFPGVKPRVDADGLCEIFGLGPAKTNGKGVFKDIYEVPAGAMLVFNERGPHQKSYWSLVSAPHEDDYETTVEKTSFLLYDAVKRQMISDIPICTLLSGGVDSSLVTAICAKELAKEDLQLRTYSFDFKDNNKHFQSNSFQPTQDRPYVDIMIDHVKSRHTYLECDNLDLADCLYPTVDARDLPNMADVESSLLYFCRKVAAETKVTLTGECADEYAHICYQYYNWLCSYYIFYCSFFSILPYFISIQYMLLLFQTRLGKRYPTLRRETDGGVSFLFTYYSSYNIMSLLINAKEVSYEEFRKAIHFYHIADVLRITFYTLSNSLCRYDKNK